MRLADFFIALDEVAQAFGDVALRWYDGVQDGARLTSLPTRYR
jgi:hypothetical protein